MSHEVGRGYQIVSKGCRSPKSVVVNAETMLQHWYGSEKSSDGGQFLECESEAVAFATVPVTTVNFSHNLLLASRSSRVTRDQK